MKVLCIKEGKWIGIKSKQTFKGPEYGDKCTVIGESLSGELPVYFLLEWPDKDGWAQKRFIPLSNIDETEMVRNYQTEKV